MYVLCIVVNNFVYSSLVRLFRAKQLSRHVKFVWLIGNILRVKLVYL